MTDKKVTTTRARTRKPRVVMSAAILERIFDRVADGESLNKICSEPKMPARKTFFEWVAKDESILRQYEFAILLRADTYAEETIEIADDTSADKYEDDKGRILTDNAVVARSRLMVDTRKWFAARLNPKKYGDRVTNEHEGNPDKPINHSVQISFIKSDK